MRSSAIDKDEMTKLGSPESGESITLLAEPRGMVLRHFNRPLKMNPQGPYNFTFTAASLRPELLSTVAGHFLRLGSWLETKEMVLSTNALQSRSRASAVRMEREIRQRLQELTRDQLKLVHDSTKDVRTCLCWLAAVKRSAFLFDFASEVLTTKWEQHDSILRASDYERFIEEKTADHRELLELTSSSSRKVRNVLLLMLREIGFVTSGTDLGTIQRIVLPPVVQQVVCSDNPKWLAAFLFPEAEINSTKARRP
jgi:hypothetical protein